MPPPAAQTTTRFSPSLALATASGVSPGWADGAVGPSNAVATGTTVPS